MADTHDKPDPHSSQPPSSARTESGSHGQVTHLSQAMIAERAYTIWQSRLGDPGDPIDDWLRAERELLRIGYPTPGL